MFLMTAACCTRFPGLSPFAVYRERFHDVLCLFADLKQEHNEKSLRNANGGKMPPEGSFLRGNTLYIPAQNDDWY